MDDTQLARRFDDLAVQVHEWTDSAVALDEGHFPNEMLNELTDLIDELKVFLDEAGDNYGRTEITELFVTPEMAEVIDRFPRVRKYLERAWGAQLTDLIKEEGEFEIPGGDDDVDDPFMGENQLSRSGRLPRVLADRPPTSRGQ